MSLRVRKAETQLREISQICAILATELGTVCDDLTLPGATDFGEVSAALVAKRLLRLRRQREALFGAVLFADPAWDIMLDLLVAESSDKQVSVSSLCIAASVPSTTALRWITALVKRGLIVRTPHPSDRRTIFVSLAPETKEKLEGLLRTL